MRSDGPTTSGHAAELAVSVALVGACGSDDDQSHPNQTRPALGSIAAIDADPP
jgi:hypothetical protein